MPAVSGVYQTAPSCWDRIKLGFMIGASVGMASGVIFGGYSVLRCIFIYCDQMYEILRNKKLNVYLLPDIDYEEEK